ncbi:MAG: hypothetical protein ACJ71Y_17275 [Blastococcus sp.]
MSVLLVIAIAWVALSVPVALLLGRALRVADRREQAASLRPMVPDFIPAEVLASVAAADGRR